MNEYEIKWTSISGLIYSMVCRGKTKTDAMKAWRKSWKHIPKRQIIHVKEMNGTGTS